MRTCLTSNSRGRNSTTSSRRGRWRRPWPRTTPACRTRKAGRIDEEIRMRLPSYPPDADGTQPPNDSPAYRSTALRHPKGPLHVLPQRLTEVTGPLFGHDRVSPGDDDMTQWSGGEAVGQHIVVHGRVVDSGGRAVPDALVEVWQANAAGRYRHVVDQHPAPLDPNFSGAGRCLTNDEGRYRFVTVKPGAYPWGNHQNAWRPAHIHFSIFGRMFTQRLVTQMYFPGDPLFPHDPIFNSVRDPKSRRL